MTKLAADRRPSLGEFLRIAQESEMKSLEDVLFEAWLFTKRQQSKKERRDDIRLELLYRKHKIDSVPAIEKFCVRLAVGIRKFWEGYQSWRCDRILRRAKSGVILETDSPNNTPKARRAMKDAYRDKPTQEQKRLAKKKAEWLELLQ